MHKEKYSYKELYICFLQNTIVSNYSLGYRFLELHKSLQELKLLFLTFVNLPSFNLDSTAIAE